MKRTILTAIAVSAVLLVGATAQAQDNTYYFYTAGGSGNFNDPCNWYTDDCNTHSSRSAVPTGNDRAVICVGQTCSVTASASVDTIAVYGTLNIQANQTLAMDNGSSSNSVVDGTINLIGSSSILSFTSANHSVSGSGTLDGQNNSAVIAIASGQTLTSSITISGNCQIVPASGSSTTFTNNGTVHANNAGILLIAPDTLGGSGDWEVSTSGDAVLRFQTGSTSLTGDFTVSNGTLDIDENVTTTGELDQTGGTIDVQGYIADPEENAKTFTAQST